MFGKYLVCLIFYFSFIGCNIKNTKSYQGIDSLKKYSYMIVGIHTTNGQKPGSPDGTGFFIRDDNNQLHFITAKHIVSCINTFTKEPTPLSYDTIEVRYFHKSDSTIDYIPLYLKDIKYKIKNQFFYESPDVISFLANGDFSNADINSVEKMVVDYSKLNEPPEKIIIFGYSVTKNMTGFTERNFPLTCYQEQPADLAHIDPAYPNPDSINLVLQPETIEGVSGAPVFYKYPSSEKMVFGGVAFGKDSIYKSTYIVRPDIVIREMFYPSIFIK
jgi:hypothetical protein